jgi:hypothetical protein
VDEFVADPKPRLDHYQGDIPLFDEFGCEAQIDANLGRKVWLKSGGSLIVDQSEALTAIDVNTGRYVGKRDLEETVLRTNLEAVREVVNQLRFRNIGGLIIIDLIDMESSENREKVYRQLQEALRSDKSKTNILKISELGLVEMTRKRTRENLVQTLCEPCPYCERKGYVLSAESAAHKLLREIQKDLPRFGGRQLAVTVSRRVAEQLLGPASSMLESLEERLGRKIEVRARADMHQEQFELTSLDEAVPVSFQVPWLDTREPASEAEDDPAASDEGEGGQGEATVDAEPTPEPVATAPEETPEAPAEEPPLATAEAPAEESPVATAETPSEEKPEVPAPGLPGAPEVAEPAAEAVSQPVDATGESPILRRFAEET